MAAETTWQRIRRAAEALEGIEGARVVLVSITSTDAVRELAAAVGAEVHRQTGSSSTSGRPTIIESLHLRHAGVPIDAQGSRPLTAADLEEATPCAQ
jgi:hypothetical protein